MKKIFVGIAISSVMLFGGSLEHGMQMLEQGNTLDAYVEFSKLAKQGDVDAQTILGEMYLDGIGVKQDTKKAYDWLSKAAKSGDKEAQYLLGFMYENGIGVKVDIVKAVNWYEKAANKGDIMAMYNLAFIYKSGAKGVKKDINKAISLLEKVEVTKKQMN